MHDVFKSELRTSKIVFMDIDNTFLKVDMEENGMIMVGSDQWFKWQLSLIEKGASEAEGRIAIDMDELVDKLMEIYQVAPIQLCESYVPQLLLNQRNMHLIFITMRSKDMHNVTKQHIDGLLPKGVVYDLITCNGGCKLDRIVDYLACNKAITATELIMVDDSLEHFTPFFTPKHKMIPKGIIDVKLFHYVNQLDNVNKFKCHVAKLYGKT